MTDIPEITNIISTATDWKMTSIENRKGKPVIKSKLATVGDPRKFKKVYYNNIFFKNKEAYDFFVEMYDEAVKEGSRAPNQIAWIKFRDIWKQLPDGSWTQ